MQNKLSYIRKFISVICWPILLGIGQFLIVAFLTTIFMINQYKIIEKSNPNYTSNQIAEELNNIDIQNKLTSFLNDNLIIIILFNILIILPILIKVYKKNSNSKKIKTNMNTIFLSIIGAFSFSILFNIVISKIEEIGPSTSFSLYFILILISKGIVGPIIEEYLFRGIIYNKLKQFNKKRNAIVIATLIFALFHNNLAQVFLAIFLSLILIKLYDKYESLLIPIIFHITVNITAIIFTPYLHSVNIFFTLIIVIISLIILINYIKNIYNKS